MRDFYECQFCWKEVEDFAVNFSKFWQPPALVRVVFVYNIVGNTYD